MSTPVLSVSPGATVAEIAVILLRGGVRAVPVIDDDGRLVGVVSGMDLHPVVERPAAGRPHRSNRSRPVHRSCIAAKVRPATARELMTAPAVVVRLEASVASAARIMREHGLGWLPVVDDEGSVVGVLGRADLLAVHHRPDSAIKAEIVGDVLERMLMVHPPQVSVEVTEGVVTLTGQVETWSVREFAVRFAERLEGVVRVVDRLSHRVDERFAPARQLPLR